MIITFLLGLILGANVGLLVLGLCAAARDPDHFDVWQDWPPSDERQDVLFDGKLVTVIGPIHTVDGQHR